MRTRRTAAAGTDGLFGADRKGKHNIACLFYFRCIACRMLDTASPYSANCTPFIFVRLSPQIRTDFPQICRGESRFARQAEVKWVVEGCFSVSLAKSSVFSRRRKTPRGAVRLVQLSPKGSLTHATVCTRMPKPFFQKFFEGFKGDFFTKKSPLSFLFNSSYSTFTSAHAAAASSISRRSENGSLPPRTS